MPENKRETMALRYSSAQAAPLWSAPMNDETASFGFQDLIARYGVERRVHTAGEDKSMLDPFRPERPEDVERLKALQKIDSYSLDVHSFSHDKACWRFSAPMYQNTPELS